MSKLYVVLIKAHTGLGSIARLVKRFEYTHVAICFDKEFKDFYTFSRRYHYLPSDCGYMVEKRDFYAFGDHEKFKVKIFELDVSDSKMEEIKTFMKECETDSEMMFNAISMAFAPVEIYKTHNCMTFTAKILEITGIINMPKTYYKMRLNDIDSCLKDYLYFEGDLDRTPSNMYDEYMRKFSIFKRIGGTVSLFYKLLVRMFTKK